MDVIGHSLNEVFKELQGRLVVGFLHQLRVGELAGAVDAYEE